MHFQSGSARNAVAEIVRSLPPAAFWPRPKVDSAIVRLDLEEHRRSQNP